MLNILMYFMAENQFDVDDLWTNVKLANRKFHIVVNVYRHPSSIFDLFKKSSSCFKFFE